MNQDKTTTLLTPKGLPSIEPDAIVAPTGERQVVPGKNGGYRPGSGRPKGSGNKMTVEKLLKEIDNTLGKPLEVIIAENYLRAQSDPKLAHAYEQMILNKVMADRHQSDVTSDGNPIGVLPSIIIATQVNNDSKPQLIDTDE